MQRFVVSLALLTVAAGCGAGSAGAGLEPVPTAPGQLDARGGRGNVEVERVRVFIRAGTPQAYVEGPLGDGCTRLLPIEQARDGSTIVLTLTSVREGEVCTMIMQFVNRWVPLDGIDAPGKYVVRANEARVAFELVRGVNGQLRVVPDPGSLPE